MSAAAPIRSRDAAATMDRIYRRQRFIYDLTRKYYLLGRDRLVGELAAGSGAVLEIGCGTGRNLAAAARRYPEARLFGIDISSVMLTTAEANLVRRNLSGRVSTMAGDATSFDAGTLFGRAGFDRVFMSYTLSMIPDWRAALERSVAALSPGGRLLIVDFGRQDGLPAWFGRLLLSWLALFHVHPIVTLEDALEDLAERHGLELELKRLFRGYAVYAVLSGRD